MLAQLPQSTIVEVRVASLDPMDDGGVLARFETIRRDARSQPRTPQHWLAVIRYRYGEPPARVEERIVNPFGFEVFGYVKSAETVPDVERAAPPEPGMFAPDAPTLFYQQPAPIVVPQLPAPQPSALPPPAPPVDKPHVVPSFPHRDSNL
jgi:type IV secretion system protein VirB8